MCAVYRNIKTGEKVYTPFPAGVINEQNYGDQLRALAFILTSVCNVSIQKTILDLPRKEKPEI